MTDIIEFPRHKIVREAPVNNELLEIAKEKGLTNFSDAVTDSIVDNIMYDLQTAGIDIESNEFIRDMSLTVDSLKATIYRAFGVHHHLHDFIDSHVKLMSDDGVPLAGEVEEETESVETEAEEGC